MSRPLRYLVEIPGEPLVGYHTGLGNKEARSFAIHTAARYGGRVIVEDVDGSMETVKDYRRKESIEESKESAANPV